MELTHFFALLFILLLISAGINVTRNILYQRRLRRSGIREIDRMDGLLFEAYLEELFRNCGYKAKKTQGSGDFGADLIVHMENKKVVVQAKRYALNNKVGLKAVQEVYAAARYYNADLCCVVTTSFYTQQAKILAGRCDVQLIDREELIRIIEKKNVTFG